MDTKVTRSAQEETTCLQERKEVRPVEKIGQNIQVEGEGGKEKLLLENGERFEDEESETVV